MLAGHGHELPALARAHAPRPQVSQPPPGLRTRAARTPLGWQNNT